MLESKQVLWRKNNFLALWDTKRRFPLGVEKADCRQEVHNRCGKTLDRLFVQIAPTTPIDSGKARICAYSRTKCNGPHSALVDSALHFYILLPALQGVRRRPCVLEALNPVSPPVPPSAARWIWTSKYFFVWNNSIQELNPVKVLVRNLTKSGVICGENWKSLTTVNTGV